MKLPLSSILAAFAVLTSGLPAEEVVPVQVLSVVSADLPKLTKNQLSLVLDRAQRLISARCGRNVRFSLQEKEEAVEDFLAPLLKRGHFPERYSWSIFDGDIPTLQREVQRICAPFAGDPARFLDPSRVPLPKGVDELSAAVFEDYVVGLARLRLLTSANGEHIFRKDNWKMYSGSRWVFHIQTMPWRKDPQLIIFNGFLVEDELATASLLTLARGGVLNGFSDPASNLAVVGYHPILSGDLVAGNPKLAGMSPEEQCNALAFLIAKHVGVHTLLGMPADLTEQGGIAMPLQLVPDKAALQDGPHLNLRVMDVPKPGETNPTMVESHTEKVLLRMYVLCREKRWQDTVEEYKRTQDPLFDEAFLPRAEKYFAEAKRGLRELEPPQPDEG